MEQLTAEHLQALAAIAQKRAEERRAHLVAAERLTRMDGIAEDVGLILLSQTLAMMPPIGTDLRQMVLDRYDSDPKFAAALRAYVNLIEDWLTAERRRCVGIVMEIPLYPDEPHCCQLDENGEAETRNEACTCWRADVSKAAEKIAGMPAQQAGSRLIT